MRLKEDEVKAAQAQAKRTEEEKLQQLEQA
jgi:hypothetical protein